MRNYLYYSRGGSSPFGSLDAAPILAEEHSTRQRNVRDNYEDSLRRKIRRIGAWKNISSTSPSNPVTSRFESPLVL